jgi:hypothetical protein
MPPWIKVGGEYQANNRFPQFSPSAPKPFVALARACLETDVKKRPVFGVIITELKTMLEAWQQGFDSLELPAGSSPSASAGAGAAPGSPGQQPQAAGVGEAKHTLSDWVSKALPGAAATKGKGQ